MVATEGGRITINFGVHFDFKDGKGVTGQMSKDNGCMAWDGQVNLPMGI